MSETPDNQSGEDKYYDLGRKSVEDPRCAFRPGKLASLKKRHPNLHAAYLKGQTDSYRDVEKVPIE